MGNDDRADTNMQGPAVELRPFAKALHHIGQGEPEKVDPETVAAEIRTYGSGSLPEAVELWLCDYLEGSIETRGRKGNSPLEQRLLGQHARNYYEAIRKAQRNDPDALPEAVSVFREYEDRIPDGYSPSETAWMIVSSMLCGQPGHHKKLRNLAGAVKTEALKSARK